MNKQDWQQYVEKLKRPESILGLCAGVGFILCLLFLFSIMLPELKETRAAEQELEQAEQQLAALLAISDPETIEEEQVKGLLLQVPLTHASDQILRALIAMQASTGAQIVSMTNKAPMEESKQDVLSQYLADQAANQKTAQQAQEQADGSLNEEPSPPTDEQTSDEDEIVTSFLQYETELQLHGSYLQIHHFFDLLHTHERLFRMKAWDISPGEEEGKLQASITVAYYAAPDYAPLLGEYASEEGISPDGTRRDPTLTNEEFHNRLTEAPTP